MLSQHGSCKLSLAFRVQRSAARVACSSLGQIRKGANSGSRNDSSFESLITRVPFDDKLVCVVLRCDDIIKGGFRLLTSQSETNQFDPCYPIKVSEGVGPNIRRQHGRGRRKTRPRVLLTPALESLSFLSDPGMTPQTEQKSHAASCLALATSERMGGVAIV